MTERRFPASAWATAFRGIAWRETLRFVQQRGRFLAALVRPLVWLFIFAAGFRAVLGLSITPPYQTYVLYEVYVTPGLVAMIQLFNGMQSSLSMVYDRETGAMRTLLVSPFPRWFLLGSKLMAGVIVSIIQAYAFLLIAWFWAACLGLCRGAASPGPVGADAGRVGAVPVIRDPAVGKFCGRDELRDLPDVLRVIGALSAVADAGKLAPAARHLRGQSLHLCGRTDPLRAVPADQLAGPGDRRGLPCGLLRGRRLHV
jgi:ABC-2 type transporter